MNRLWGLTSCVAILVLAAGLRDCAAEGPADTARVAYNRDIRPILADRCFRCHGPDSGHRKAGLRLDRRDDAVADRDGRQAIVPGDLEASEVVFRINAEDADVRMPPAGSGLVLRPDEIARLERWIEQGAEYQPHWAFLPPQRPRLPALGKSKGGHAWPRNPVDVFILAELQRHGLEPAPEAPREILLRRVTLDLTGLPPTPAERDAFLGDPAPDAYERAVDRLLASPRYGERMALDWLDAARYADTNGYYTDLERHAWPWRNWVIDAFNRNVPFDRFTIEQLSGDLLPAPTSDQKIATGFNRNHMVTNESGVIEEEARVGYVVDRVDTTATVWLGLTVGCARCHDHKYDPITQKEYYRLFAYFNNVPETGLVKDPVNPTPVLSLPTLAQERRLADLHNRRVQCESRLKAEEPALNAALDAWEKRAVATLPRVPQDTVAYFPLDTDGTDRGIVPLATTTIGTLRFGPGVLGSAATFDGTQYVEFECPASLEGAEPFSVAFWVRPGSGPSGCLISKLDATPEGRGFEVIWYKSKPWINLVHQSGQSAIEVVPRQTFSNGDWHHVAITYDGSGKAAGLTLYVDGEVQSLIVRRDSLAGPVASDEPWRIAWKPSGVGFEGSLDELRLHDRVLDPDEVAALACRTLIEGTIRTPRARRTRQQTERLRTYYIAHEGSDELRGLTREAEALRSQEEEVRRSIVSTPIMQELNRPRTTRVLARGQYDQPGETVTPGVPAALSAGSAQGEEAPNRLGLARWLVSPENPLTARVAVNRSWQLVFGEGLVRTVNDFGLQGELPSHPELLDWLAVEFLRSGWDVRGLIRLLVTSATYRQASRFTPELLARDPENRLLARGPRYRLPAELIRDQALAVSGLLVERLGGPSVKPYQPPGLWEAVSYNGDQTYEQDHGDALYRRSLYTYWKRQAPPPALLTFDGPTREVCTARRARTNTPLQSLVLLNDVTYVEAARGLAMQLMRQRRSEPAALIRDGFQRVTGRRPRDDEVAALERLYHRQLAAYRERPESARALLRMGEFPIDPALDPCELAAWSMTASLLLNLDETITRH
jgi:hypothetical protein